MRSQKTGAPEITPGKGDSSEGYGTYDFMRTEALGGTYIHTNRVYMQI